MVKSADLISPIPYLFKEIVSAIAQTVLINQTLQSFREFFFNVLRVFVCVFHSAFEIKSARGFLGRKPPGWREGQKTFLPIFIQGARGLFFELRLDYSHLFGFVNGTFFCFPVSTDKPFIFKPPEFPAILSVNANELPATHIPNNGMRRLRLAARA